MNRMRASAIALVIFAAGPAQLLPSAGAQSITITSASSPNKGQAYGSGNYDPGKGNTFNGVIVTASQNGKLVATGNTTAMNNVWGGIVLGLTSGQSYDIGAIMTYTSGGVQMMLPTNKQISVKVQ